MTLALVPIPFDKLEAARGNWFPFVEQIAKRQRCFVEQRLADIFSGQVALILAWEPETRTARGLIGYSVTVRGHDRIFKLAWVTGKRQQLLELNGELEQFARHQLGCAGMVALARPGWAADLKRWGYRLAHVEYEKDFA